MRPSDPSQRAARPPVDDATDAALFEAVAAGQLGPLGVLFDRHHLAVRKFLRCTYARSEDIDDLVQETFLTASRAAPSFDGSDSARPFLLGIAAQLVRRQRRTFARIGRLLGALSHAVSSPRKSPEDLAVETSQRSRLDRAVMSLPEGLREVLVLVDGSEMSGVDAARILEIPAGTVWRRLHDARARLKAILAEEDER